MKSGVADGSKIQEHDIAVGLLQGQCSIDCGRGAPGASLGAQESEDSRPARRTRRMTAGRAIAGERLQQRLRAPRLIQILPCAGAHGRDNVGGLRHLAVGEDGNLLRGSPNELDGTDGRLRVLRGNVDDYDFSARLLKRSENRVGRTRRKANMMEDRAPQARFLQTFLKCRNLFRVLGQEGNCDPMHSAVLADFSRCLHVKKRTCSSPSDLGNGTNYCWYATSAVESSHAISGRAAGRKCTTSGVFKPLFFLHGIVSQFLFF